MSEVDPNIALVSTYKSRKFVLAIVALIVITGISVASIWFAAVAGILPTCIGGILGVLSIYMGGNVANKFVMGKTQVEFKKAQETVPAEPEGDM